MAWRLQQYQQCFFIFKVQLISVKTNIQTAIMKGALIFAESVLLEAKEDKMETRGVGQRVGFWARVAADWLAV